MHALFYKKQPLDSCLAKYAWIMENEAREKQPTPDLLIPDGCPELIFVLEGGYRKRRIHEKEGVAIRHSCVVGLQTATLLVERIGKVRIAGVKFNPLGFYRLFGEKAVGAVDQNIPIDNFGEDWLCELHRQLATCPDNRSVLERLNESPWERPPGEGWPRGLAITRNCIRSIIGENGNISLRELSNHYGKSGRQLQRYFKKYVGISPKQFISLIRFKALYKEVVIGEEELHRFFDFGYYDQTHFIKDFKAQLGITPSKMGAESFRKKNEIARKSSR